MVVRFDLERHGITVADIDHAGVLAHAHQQSRTRTFRNLFSELAQVDLRRLVGAVLGPHHRVHRELRARRPASQNLVDSGVFVVPKPEFGVWLALLG